MKKAMIQSRESLQYFRVHLLKNLKWIENLTQIDQKREHWNFYVQNRHKDPIHAQNWRAQRVQYDAIIQYALTVRYIEHRLIDLVCKRGLILI